MENLNGFLWKIKNRDDDDAVNKLNYLYTPLILLVFALTIGGKEYLGSPIECFVPAQFKDSWESYVEEYCFIHNTYYFGLDKEIPNDVEKREKQELGYYQWVPFVLALQALLFFLPRLGWTMLSAQSGMNVSGMIQMAFPTKRDSERLVLRRTEEGIPPLLHCLKAHIDYRTNVKEGRKGLLRVRGWLERGWGVWLNISYLSVKVLFIVNVAGQFFLMNSFLGANYSWWGVGILRDLANGTGWETSGHFPRVTLCDFRVRRQGNLQTYTTQCVLNINMLNEKCFLFLWWWCFFVAVLTSINLLYWTTISLVPQLRLRFVRSYLSEEKRNQPVSVRHFTHQILRPDNILLLRLMVGNAGEVKVYKILNALWDEIYDQLNEPEIDMEYDEPHYNPFQN